MKLFVMMAYRHWPQPSPVMVEMVDVLRQQGFDVELGLAAEGLWQASEWRPRHDLYVLKSHSLYWAHQAAALEAQGARLLDSAQARFLLCSKLRLAQRLHEAGLPHPATWSTSELAHLRPLLARHPLLLKPDAGSRGRDVRLLPDEAALDALPPLTEPTIAQQYLDHEPEDIKAYVIGEQVYAVRKAFGPESFKTQGRPTRLTPAQEALILACGRACGVSLYGVDLIITAKGPMIVDVNWFPSYRAVPGAAQRLATWIARAATHVAH